MVTNDEKRNVKRTAANRSAKFIKGTLIQIKSGIIEIICYLNGFPRDGKLPVKI